MTYPAYDPAWRNSETYRAAVFIDAHAIMNPTIPIMSGQAVCQNFSWVRSLCQLLTRATSVAKIQGGADMHRVL